jgi:TPR repeat protein
MTAAAAALLALGLGSVAGAPARADPPASPSNGVTLPAPNAPAPTLSGGNVQQLAKPAAAKGPDPYELAIAAAHRGDFATAVKILQPLADKGESRAELNLAALYIEGAGVPKDPVRGAALMKKAAEQGVAQAQYLYGILMLGADGVQRNMPEAMTWLAKAADQGHPVAQYNLATIYRSGLGGVTPDAAKAVDYFTKAADAGEVRAETDLASMYRKGEGVPKDPAKAMALLTKAAQRRYGVAEYDLAALYKSGEAGKPDPVQAYVWFSLAASQPMRDRPEIAELANGEIQALTGTMTAEQIDQAKALVGIWTGH